MSRFLYFAAFIYVFTSTAFGFIPNNADVNNPFPASSSYSHPKLSPLLRNDLSLRNTGSTTKTIEVLSLAGSVWEPCSIQSERKWAGIKGTKHQRFIVICHGLPVYNAYISKHGTLLTQGALPLGVESFASNEGILSMQEVRDQMTTQYNNISEGQLVYFFKDSEKMMIPAYVFKYRQNFQTMEALYDARNAKRLVSFSRSLHFKSAYTFLENSIDSPLEKVNLDGLRSDSVLLESEQFIVYGTTLSSSRASADGSEYTYQPEDIEYFDQVQTYFTLNRAYNFFKNYFNLDGSPIEVFTHANLVNNAMYLPEEPNYLPAIVLGRGDGFLMENLSRDSDVAIHEYSHHIIFKFLKATWGESLMLHEGTADFFAFILNKDTDLAESILIGENYLRSASAVDGLSYDDEKQYRGNHYLGQFWSSLLWSLKEELEDDALTIITNSLNYWPKDADLEDAILGLLLSDKEVTDGNNQCTILQLSYNLGMIEALADIDQSSCQGFSQSYDQRRVQQANQESSSSKDELIPGCGSIGQQSSSASFLLLTLPLILLMRRSSYEA